MAYTNVVVVPLLNLMGQADRVNVARHRLESIQMAALSR